MAATYYQQQNANYVTILSIYDEEDDADKSASSQLKSQSPMQPPVACSSPVSTSSKSKSHRNQTTTVLTTNNTSDGDIVEITSLAEPPTHGLRVLSGAANLHDQQPSSSSIVVTDHNRDRDEPPSLRHYQQSSTSSTYNKRHLQSVLTNESNNRSSNKNIKHKYSTPSSSTAAAECNSKVVSTSDNNSAMIERNNLRKSRITESLLDAKERLEEEFSERNATSLLQKQKQLQRNINANNKIIPPLASSHPGRTVIILSDSTINTPIGIEISPVYDPANSSRLLAVEIRHIDDEGRIALDGRIRCGDRLTEINERPVYQMSISRARAYLHELQSSPHPTFTVDRPIESFLCAENEISHSSNQPSSSSLHKKPILSALQQANTTAIGQTSNVQVTKLVQGFGFTVTSRDTAKGERLFYIGTVKKDGAAIDVLKAGDRLLEINGESTTGLLQNDVVDRLKKLNVGETVKLLISRIPNSMDDNDAKLTNAFKKKLSLNDEQQPQQQSACDVQHQRSKSEEVQKRLDSEQILDLDIALNETGSAGLGVSLKARAVMKPDGTREDCGIFIKKVLHGGAAFKDGRLQVNDQLIGIEDIDLRCMLKNADASDAITKRLKEIGPSASSVRLRIARSTDAHSLVLPSKLRSDLNECKENEQHSNTAEYINSDSSNITRHQSDDDETSYNGGDVDAFDRENPTRRSISEKRHMGSSSHGASHTLAYQKIKKLRQASVSPKRRSLSLDSSSVKRKQSNESRNLSNLSEVDVNDEVISTNHTNKTPSKKQLPSAMKRAPQQSTQQQQRSLSISSPSFRQAIDDQNVIDTADNDNMNNQLSMNSHQSRRLHKETSPNIRDKTQRRKSAGSSLFSRLSQKLGGSRSREASPEKIANESCCIESSHQFEEEKNRKKHQQRVEFVPNDAVNSYYKAGVIPPPYYFGCQQSYSYDPYEQENASIQRNAQSYEYERKRVSATLSSSPHVHSQHECIPSSNNVLSVANSKFYASMNDETSSNTSGHQPFQDTKSIRYQQKTNSRSDPHLHITTKTSHHVKSKVASTTTTTANQEMQATSSAHRPSTDNISTTQEEQHSHMNATTTMRSIRGSHRVQPADGSSVRIPASDTSNSQSTTNKTKHHHKTHRQPHKESTTKDSGRAQAKSRCQLKDSPTHHQQIQPSTTIVGRSMPAVVFPTSRTLFIGASSSNAAFNSSSARLRRSSKGTVAPAGVGGSLRVSRDSAQSSASADKTQPSKSNTRSCTNKVNSQKNDESFHLNTFEIDRSLKELHERMQVDDRHYRPHPSHNSVKPSTQQHSQINYQSSATPHPYTIHSSSNDPYHDISSQKQKHFKAQSLYQNELEAPARLSRNALKYGRASADLSGVVTFVNVSPSSPLYLQTLLESSPNRFISSPHLEPQPQPTSHHSQPPTRIIPIQRQYSSQSSASNNANPTKLLKVKQTKSIDDDSISHQHERNVDYRQFWRASKRDRQLDYSQASASAGAHRNTSDGRCVVTSRVQSYHPST